MGEVKDSRIKPSRPSAYHCFNQMAWPLPGERLEELEHRLRHGHPDARDIALAASVVAAYLNLVLCDKEKREKVVSKVKGEAKRRDRATT